MGVAASLTDQCTLDLKPGFFFSSRRRHTRCSRDWSSDVCSSDLQIRQSIAYSGKNVKICASHAGVTLGEDGATHQILEDIGLMKMLPGMTVIVPCDYAQTKAATEAIADYEGPVYLRFGRPAWPIFTTGNPFEIGKAQYFSEGTDVTIFACGHMVWNAIQAGAALQEKGISVEVINIHTVKPLDEAAVLQSLRKTKCAVTAEE